MPGLVSKILRWVLSGTLAVLVLGAVAIELVSWNFLRTPIENYFEAATGRSLSIDGDLSLGLFPRPLATVNALTLENPGWAEAPRMLQIERISVRPSLWAALRGQVVLEEVKIKAPRLNLQARADGTTNWNFPGLEGSPPDAGSGTALAVRELSLRDARIHYRTHDRSSLALSIPSLQLEDDGESTTVRASMTFREKTFDLEAQADSLRRLTGSGGGFSGELAMHAEGGRLNAGFDLASAPQLAPAHVDWALELQNLTDWSRWAGQPAVDLQTLKISSRLDHEASRWRFTGIETVFAGSRVNGELELDTGGQAPVLSASLHAPEFDAAALLAALPENTESEGSLAERIPPLPTLAASIGLSIDNLLWDPYRIRNLEAELNLQDQVLAMQTLDFEVAGGRVVANADLTSTSEDLALALNAKLKALDLALLDEGQAANGIVAGELAVSLPPVARQRAPDPGKLIAQVQIEQATMTYTDETGQTDLRASLTTNAAPASPRITLTGEFQDRAIEATVTGDAWTALASAPADYALHAAISSGAASMQVDTRLASLLQPRTLAATFSLDADNVRDLEPWLQRQMPSVPALRAAGRLERDGEQWDATRLEIEAGKSRASGEIHFRNARRPFLEARLHATRIDPIPWTVNAGTAEEQAPDPESRTPDASRTQDADSLLAVLRTVDAEFDLRVERLDLPTDADVRDLAVAGVLKGGNARIEPLRLALADGQLSASLDLDVGEERAFGRLEVALENIVLDRLGETFTPLEDRLGSLSGALNLEITETRAGAMRDDLLFPYIGRIRFRESRLHFTNSDAQTDMMLTLQTRGLADGAQEFRIAGSGSYDGEPFSLVFKGDEMLHARDPQRPFALQVNGEIVETRFDLSGTLLRPFALRGMDLELSLEGPDPQRLERVLGIPFPALPAYSVSGELSLNDLRWLLQKLDGQVGGSDLSGQLGIDISARPPHVSGTLQSDSVRMEDLAGLFGARQDADKPEDDDTAADNRRILPQQPLINDAWQDLTADVRYRGHSLRAADVPLSNIAINLHLENGRLQFAPVTFGVGDGSVDFNLDLDVSARPSNGTLDATVRGVDLQKALSEWELAEDSVGVVGGEGKFWVEGDSIADILASADGGLLMLMHGGRLDAVLIELAGLDAAQVFTSVLGDRDPVPIDCAYVDVKTRDGIATLDTFVIDTDDTGFSAGGEIDFAEERLGITLLATPKDVSVGTARSPVQISGTFNDIGLGIAAEGLGARLAGAAMLGALATPLSALIPLLDLGSGEDSELCQGLVRRSHEAIKSGGGGQ